MCGCILDSVTLDERGKDSMKNTVFFCVFFLTEKFQMHFIHQVAIFKMLEEMSIFVSSCWQKFFINYPVQSHIQKLSLICQMLHILV